MTGQFVVEPLARHPALAPLLAQWFVDEWPAWYGLGGQGDVTADVQRFAASDTQLPIGFVVFSHGTPIGASALKADSIASHTHLSPWAAAGYVIAQHRRQGVGAQLLGDMVQHARSLGHPHVYCGTSTAQTLLKRCGWRALETIQHADKPLTIFCSPA